MPNNLTGQNISDTYQRLLQVEGNIITDGTGSAVTASHAITASYAHTASIEITKEVSSSYAETASMASSNFIIQGHLTASGNISSSGGTVTALSGSFNHIITDGNTIEFRNATTGNKEGTLKFDSSTGLQIGDDSTGNADLKANTITAVSKFVSDGTAEFESNVTMSGNFSASGKIHTSQIITNGLNSITPDGTTLVFGNDANKTELRGSSVTLGSTAAHHVTASGNISSSGFVAGNAFRGNGRIYPGYNISANHFIGKTTVSNPIIRAVGGFNVDGHVTASGIISASGEFIGPSAHITHITASGHISASGIIRAEGLLISDDATITDDLFVNGDIRIGQTNSIGNASQIGTNIQFNSGQMLFDCNSIELMRLSSTSGVVFNVTGQNALDFTIEGDSDQSLFFVDAGADKVAIGTATVGSSLLTVDGDITATSLTASVAISASVINGAGTGTAQLNVAGQITASGNISSSAIITGNVISGSIISGSFVGDGSGITNLVTTTNVTNAGALMDSEVDADIKTLVLPASTTISTFGASLIDDAAASNARTTLGLGTAATTAASDYATAAQGSKADSAQQPPSEGAFANGDKTKLDNIEASADVTDTTNVTAAGALMDSELSDLAAVKAINQGLTTTSNVTFNAISGSNISASGNYIGSRQFNQSNATNNQLTQGDIVYFGTQHPDVDAGDIVYLKTDGQWNRSDAAIVGRASRLHGIALGAAITNGILLRGMYTLDHDLGNTNAGAPLYLSTTVAELTATAPSNSGQVVRIMGYQIGDDDQIWFDPDKTWVELS